MLRLESLLLLGNGARDNIGGSIFGAAPFAVVSARPIVEAADFEIGLRFRGKDSGLVSAFALRVVEQVTVKLSVVLLVDELDGGDSGNCRRAFVDFAWFAAE